MNYDTSQLRYSSPWKAGVAAVCCFSLCSAALAAEGELQVNWKMKPGLWEITETTETQRGGPPAKGLAKARAALAQLPPDQRAKAEAMIREAENNGAGTRVRKVCNTGQTKDWLIPRTDSHGCNYAITSQTDARIAGTMQCNSEGGVKMRGHLVMKKIDAEHVKTNSEFDTANGGRNASYKFSSTSKWMSAQCGKQ